MTSSMPEARMFLCELSPMTQRSASSRLDLPQPFGPTTPVRPCSITSSVGSTKDLKPGEPQPSEFHAPSQVPSQLPAATADHAPSARARIDHLAELIDRMLAAQRLAIDEEGRRRRRPRSLFAALSRIAMMPLAMSSFFRHSSKPSWLKPASWAILHKLGARVLAGPHLLLLEEACRSAGSIYPAGRSAPA